MLEEGIHIPLCHRGFCKAKVNQVKRKLEKICNCLKAKLKSELDQFFKEH